MPAHAEGGGEVPDHIVFMVKSSDVAEIRHAANWVLSRRRDLEMHAQRMGKRGKKKTSTNPFESDDEGDSGFLSERYKVFFVPHITVVGEKILADSGILSSCDIGELHLDLVPLDDDLLSSEIENLLMENSVDGITSGCHFTVARSIMKLQRQYGIIQNVKGIGKAAQSVIEKIFSERIADARDDGEDAAVYDESEGQNIDTMVVIDREVDFVTPLLTPLTYEGLIDEVIGIQNGYIKVDPTLVEVEEVRLRVDWKENVILAGLGGRCKEIPARTLKNTSKHTQLFPMFPTPPPSFACRRKITKKVPTRLKQHPLNPRKRSPCRSTQATLFSMSSGAKTLRNLVPSCRTRPSCETDSRLDTKLQVSKSAHKPGRARKEDDRRFGI